MKILALPLVNPGPPGICTDPWPTCAEGSELRRRDKICRKTYKHTVAPSVNPQLLLYTATYIFIILNKPAVTAYLSHAHTNMSMSQERQIERREEGSIQQRPARMARHGGG